MFRYPLTIAVLALLTACHAEAPSTPFHKLASVHAEIVPVAQGDSNQLWVPDRVLTLRGGVPGVFVALNGEARFQMVKPGRREAARTQILSGLSGGEKLLGGDLKNFYDGSPLALSPNSK